MKLLPINVLLISFGIILFQPFKAQMVSGKLYDIKDSSAVEFATIVCVNTSENAVTRVFSDENGEFQINLPLGTFYLKIFKSVEYSEIKIININKSLDTVNIGSIPLIRAPEFIQVQYKSISGRRERKKQESLIKEYNKMVNRYHEIEIKRPYGKFKMIQKAESKKDESRINLVYQINFNELIIRKN
jgi:hypothetical protein